MAHREVRDGAGTVWEVWAVAPILAEKREEADPTPPETTGERRRVRSVRSRLPVQMTAGWLAIKSPTERRRLAPIPSGWEGLTEGELLALIASAGPAGPGRRQIQ